MRCWAVGSVGEQGSPEHLRPLTRSVVLDTGPLVALLNRRDRYHRWTTEQWAEVEPPVLTCEAVLTEAWSNGSRTPRSDTRPRLPRRPFARTPGHSRTHAVGYLSATSPK